MEYSQTEEEDVTPVVYATPYTMVEARTRGTAELDDSVRSPLANEDQHVVDRLVPPKQTKEWASSTTSDRIPPSEKSVTCLELFTFNHESGGDIESVWLWKE